ncbi:MAG: aminopeptidase [Deinococcales bacterium]|nr:aminopeptidase [Deinococcales bacterium]
MRDMTSSSFDSRLDAYAELLVRVGVNLQPGQKLIVRADVEDAPLVRKVVDIAYSLGSPYVEVLWGDGLVSRSRFLKGPEGSFGIVPEYRAQGMIQLAQEGAASLAITSEDPDLLADVNPENVAEFQAAWRKAVRPYMELSMRDAIQWCVAGAASVGWATKAFPGVPEQEAVERLWDAIFTATRITTDDPVRRWREHNEQLRSMRERLNERRYAAVRFKGPGTDLSVGLADGHRWDGGESKTPAGTTFVANMPTEEVFTAPHRERVDGVVRASMPLSYNGTLIDDFTLTFEGGQVVKAVAGKGQKVLDSILDTDEGARRLGEVALVPASSPIAQAGILFLNTLFDENAASHVALGRGYEMTVEGAASMSEEEKRATGLNDSLTHVDFMIGSAEMDVDGVKQDGTTEPLMRQGAWVS